VTDYGSRSDFYDTNVTGTQRLLTASKWNGVSRLIFISSPSICMDMKDQININEDYPLPQKFVNLYSETKAEAEKWVLAQNTERLITTSLRPRAIWGPRDRAGFLPQVLQAMARGRLRDLSGGKKIQASLCYCENAAKACVLASKSRSVGGKAYFITDSETVDIWQFATLLSETFNVPAVRKKLDPRVAQIFAKSVDAIWKVPYLAKNYSPPISQYRLALLTLSSTFSTQAAEKDFNYSPSVNQSTGLGRLKDWIAEIGGIEVYTRSAGQK
jgi:nucleoside-diphosphate-sugar epimerase